MDALSTNDRKPHVIFIPFPGQSHIKAMLKLAELLHHKGLQITFVNTDFVHKRFLESGGPHCLDASPADFRFETIPDGISRGSLDDMATSRQKLIHSIENFLSTPFLDLITKLPIPPTCIISDGFMSVFTIDVAQKLGIPIMLYWTLAACGFMGFYQTMLLMEKGLVPLKDESYLTNGYLDTIIDWIPGMEGIRIKDFPSMVRTTDPNDQLLTFTTESTRRSHEVSHQIFHTFDELETSIVKALSAMYSHVYTIGPLQLLLDRIPENEKHTQVSNFNGYSLTKEEPECFQWLQSKEPNSVIYVNFGSSTVMSLEDLIEFGWGLAESNYPFLWIIRSNLVVGESAALPPELEEYIKEKKGFLASWCSQEKVLNHPSVGGFLTHCGWGSTIESLSAGVPMICWPFLADQMTDCRYICKEWEVGLEMGNGVKRKEVKRVIQELMGDDRMRNKAMEWKVKAHIATGPNGSSSLNVDSLVKEISKLL
ncbi:UDP-glycosyltransferase 85C2-like [Cynara cardunculus var. scolymus]|uniref:Glycosyltransferase n=1 Tax=Cynara cardunculus var. scolymus TaxID=59895 RepID=A0A103WW45_CYNCS|nr:UDP-glycosyltransferase 85C2-like [Cynara cardunculus var. scolymus]KVH79589.1 UDP-glucuronosyl/UDP-glucosyltransferase [Cynara cardunculus var. scolymus]